HKRYAFKDGVFIVFRPLFDVLGYVKNASKGGVAFEYYDYYTHPKSAPVSIDIFSGKTSLQISRIRCQIVFDVQARAPSSKNDVRRCGLQFSSLSERQAATLDYFIRRFSKGEAARRTEENALPKAPHP
ncbi:MAG: hypothetical protein LLG06_15670, partial [Desulfobacteraceae bacterium]|nr:hypothetical protein [Desulfobacteraceae bacterium]